MSAEISPAPKKSRLKTLAVIVIAVLAFIVVAGVIMVLPDLEAAVPSNDGTNESITMGDSVIAEVHRAEEYRGRNPAQLYGSDSAQAVRYWGWVIVEARHADGTLFFRDENHNLLVDEGKEFLEDQVASTTPGTNGANYIALSNDGTAPTAGRQHAIQRSQPTV